MNRLIIPFLLVLGIIFLLTIQCTLAHRWLLWDVSLELLPALLLYAAFTVNLPTALLLGLFAAVMYDSFSAGRFGASMIPYIVATSSFCAVRPIFFRNRITTQFVSGCVFGFIALFLQWTLCGKFMVGWEHIFPKLLRLSFFSGVLAIVYFGLIDFFCRFMGLDPGRFEEYSA